MLGVGSRVQDFDYRVSVQGVGCKVQRIVFNVACVVFGVGCLGVRV